MDEIHSTNTPTGRLGLWTTRLLSWGFEEAEAQCWGRVLEE